MQLDRASAEAARDSALRHIKLIGAKLSLAHGADQACRLTAAKHKRAVALRRSHRRIADAC
jgi:hypothetical protein